MFRVLTDTKCMQASYLLFVMGESLNIFCALCTHGFVYVLTLAMIKFCIRKRKF